MARSVTETPPPRYATRLGVTVLTAARQRIARVFDDFAAVYVSFSGGKDSTVLLDLAAAEARHRGRRLGVLVVDLEAQYRATIAHAHAMLARHADVVDVHWVALPLNLRNAVSQYAPQWLCWDPARRADWVRQPPDGAITDAATFPWFSPGMEFEDFVARFGAWYGQGASTACLVGIRSQESLNRFRTLVADKRRHAGLCWTTASDGYVNAYPLYDWRTPDVWTYHAVAGCPANPVYDLMQRAGVPLHLQRICQPYGDDQRRGLYLYHVLEPETWGRVVARVNGANHGALYAREQGNILGVGTVTLPPGHTWQSYALLLLASLPEAHAEHYRDKIAVFLRWYQERGYPDGIPDAADPKLESARDVPSWRRVCKTLLRNDYWCKGLSFTQPKTGASNYERYRAVMRARRARWRLI